MLFKQRISPIDVYGVFLVSKFKNAIQTFNFLIGNSNIQFGNSNSQFGNVPTFSLEIQTLNLTGVTKPRNRTERNKLEYTEMRQNSTGMKRNEQEWYRNIPEQGRINQKNTRPKLVSVDQNDKGTKHNFFIILDWRLGMNEYAE